MEKKVRVIAMYLPQFHPIPLNDEWWGPGFTEWTNVASAKPLFKGHYQPRVPADLGFYDLRLPESREAQAKLAREAGIEGFMYWHYWFGKGKRLLERPFNEVLETGKPDFPFCLGWANHSWSRKTWTAKNGGNAGAMAVEQTYVEEEYADHFYDVLPAFKDSRYITVDGKPFFLIYNVLSVPNLKAFIDCWQKLAVENGLKGIHFVGNVNGYHSERRFLDVLNSGVDAAAFFNLTKAEERVKGTSGMYWQKLKHKLGGVAGIENYEYKDIIRNIHDDIEREERVYPVVFPQLDRTPRAGKDAIVLKNSTPELFKEFMSSSIELIKHKDSEHRIIILNSWNEWGEGNYVEPDTVFGHGYLDAISQAINED